MVLAELKHKVKIEEQSCLFIMAHGRSGSTLLLRILNTLPGYNICGENWGAFAGLSNFYANILKTKNSKELIGEKEYLENSVKPSWYNVFDIESVNCDLRVLIKNMYNPRDEFRVWGFKEIRFGLNVDYENFNRQLEFLKNLFPTTKFIFNVRSIDELVASMSNHAWIQQDNWWDNPQRASKLLLAQKDHFEKFHQANPDYSYLISYEDVLAKNDRFYDLFKFLEIDYNFEQIQSITEVRL